MICSDLHDAALYAWRGAGVRDAVLVHIDAHHDADAKEWPFVTISNFVWWALADGLLREVFWVLPDPSWATSSGRTLIHQSLLTLARQHDRSADVEARDGVIATMVGGKPFTACSLDSLSNGLDAIVDIDVDYFLVPDIAHELPPIEAMPWMWPADLIHGLRHARVSPTLVTIATSVRGGFTPLEWKYFGEELCTRLSGAPAEPFDVLRAGAEAESAGDLDAAEASYYGAVRQIPTSAGARYRLARLYLRRGNADAARRAFRGVLERDPSYRTADSTGRRRHAAGDFAAATSAYQETLRMDPENAYAADGLGRLAAASGNHAEAVVYFERALRYEPMLVDAHRGIARSLESLGEVKRAIEHYERSLRLELDGRVPLDGPIATHVPRTVNDAHWEIHQRLALLEHDTRWLEALDRLCIRTSP